MRGVSACNKVHRPFSPIDAFISVRTSILGPEATEVVQCSRSVYSLNGGGDSYTTFTMKECSLGHISELAAFARSKQVGLLSRQTRFLALREVDRTVRGRCGPQGLWVDMTYIKNSRDTNKTVVLVVILLLSALHLLEPTSSLIWQADQDGLHHLSNPFVSRSRRRGWQA